MKLHLSSPRVLLLIMVLAFGLRTLGVINIGLRGDFAYHWKVAQSIATLRELPSLGPTASIQEAFHLGPLYYYILAFIYALSFGNYHLSVVWFSLTHGASIWLLYKLAREWLSDQNALLVAFLYATSFYMITVGNYPWNPYLLPPFLFACALVFRKVQKGSHHYLPLVILLLALLLQLHGTAVFLIPVILLPLIFKKIGLKYWFLGATAAFVVFLPWLYAETGCSFCQSRAVIGTLLDSSSESCSFTEWLAHHGHGERCFGFIRNSLFVLRLVSQSIFGSSQLVLLPVILGLLGLWIGVTVRSSWWLVAWLVAPWIGFLFYNGNVYLHYFLILLPLPFFALVMTIHWLKLRFPRFIPFFNILPIGISIVNIYLFILSLHTAR